MPRSYTTNFSFIGADAGRFSQVPVTLVAQTAGANVYDPLFGRPIWSYVNTMAGPVRGPQPRLARGSGLTGDPSLPGNAPSLPGYLSTNTYQPTGFPYDTVNQPKFDRHIPRSILTGTDGHDIVGTYRAHDFTPGQRFMHQNRQAASWQVYEYPPSRRNLLQWQQVQRYRVNSYTHSARPIDSSQYFLGYQINPDVQAAIGQNTLGYMGSS